MSKATFMNELYHSTRVLILRLGMVGIFLFGVLLAIGQEICDNGVDDDGDGLIDLNDNECICSDTIALTNVTGFICKNTLRLDAENTNATNYQWYKDGVAIPFATNFFLELQESPTVEGFYTCRVETSTGCALTEIYEVIIPETILMDLGITYLCPGQCIEWDGFDLCVPGFFQTNGSSAAGCDSITRIQLEAASNSLGFFRDTICTGSTYEYYDISVTDPGRYMTTIPNAEGCDSIITVDLSVLDVLIDTITTSICSGDTLFVGDSIFTMSGTYYATSLNAQGCEVMNTIYLSVIDHTFGTFNEQICRGDTATFYDIVATESGSYLTAIPNALGCDSTITYNLIVNEPGFYAFADTICTGATYDFYSISATESGIYYDTTSTVGGCDSIIEVTLSVFDQVEITLNATICQGERYRLNTIDAGSAGTYTTEINSPTGCDSIVTVVLDVARPSGSTIQSSICEGSRYMEGNFDESTSGTYRDTLVNAVGCDSIITLQLSVEAPSTTTISETICSGQSYDFFGTDLSQSGTYRETIASLNGCDSTIVLELAVTTPILETVNDTICAGGTYSIGGNDVSLAGTYQDTLSTAQGCDSIVTINLQVSDPVEGFTTVSLCQGRSITHGTDIITTSGIYSTDLTTSQGCDSIATIEVILTPPPVSIVFDTICAGTTYDFGGEALDIAGVYIDTLTTLGGGCDSVVTLNLHINDPLASTTTAIICEGSMFVLGSQEITATGTYSEVLQTVAGCDSVATVEVTVNPAPMSDISVEICEGGTYVLNDISATTPGLYTTTLTSPQGCDSIVNVTISYGQPIVEYVTADICEGEMYPFHEHEAVASGEYTSMLQNTYGCDSMVVLQLAVTPLPTRVYEMTVCEGETVSMYDITATETGIYETMLSNTSSCDSLIVLDLIVNAPSDLIDLGDDQTISLGNTTDIIPEYLDTDVVNLVWYDGASQVLTTDDALYDFAPVMDTWVYAEGEDLSGCPAMDSLLVRVDLDIKVGIPNIFSPNGDSQNDYFQIKTNVGVVSIDSWTIYNRWGELVYQGGYTTNVDKTDLWDGTFKGQEVNPGVFAYQITVNLINGEQQTLVGDLTVVK